MSAGKDGLEAEVVIVGGGVTGLSLARELEARGVRDVLLCEQAPRLGGNIATERVEDFLLDLGPDAWVAQKPQLAALVRELGMEAELIEPLHHEARVHLVSQGKLVELPAGMVLGVPTDFAAFLRSPLFSWQAKLRVALEPLRPRLFAAGASERVSADMSVGAFAEARLGRELTETLIAPLLGGIFAGDAWDLSLQTAFPQMVRAEQDHGSLVKAFRARKAQPGGHKSPFLSLKRGMGSLIDALADSLQSTTIMTECPVHQVRREGARYVVQTAAGAISAKAVVFAGPAHVAAGTLQATRALARELREFAFGSAVTVFYALRAEDVRPIPGSGFLVPQRERGESLRILAGTVISSKWPGRAPDGHVLLRVFFGGPDAQAIDESDEALIARGLADLRRLFPVPGEPLFSRVHRLRGGSPRPAPGHLARVQALRAQLEQAPGLFLVGNGYDGSGIPDCVRQAQAIAPALAEYLRAAN